MTLLQSGITKSLAEPYDIDNSLRFNEADSAYLSRTPGSEGNRKTWTVSFWLKKSKLDDADHNGILSVYGGDSNTAFISLEFVKNTTTPIDAFRIAGWTNNFLATNQVFRDPSAWYHFVVSCDTTDTTADDRMKIYVNGVEVTSFAERNNPGEDDDTGLNMTSVHHIGENLQQNDHLGGYLADFYLIDGTAYDADDFGTLNATTNQWIPKDASDLTFGTNGFYQKYSVTELADSFEDSAERSVLTVTANGTAELDTSIKKIGTASAYWGSTSGGLSNCISMPSTDGSFDFGSGDLTVEMWVYQKATDTTRDFLSQNPAAEGTWYFNIGMNAVHGWSCEVSQDSTYARVGGSLSSGITTANDTWHHCALVRSGGTLTLYVDGTAQPVTATTWPSSWPSYSNTQVMNIGSGTTAYSHCDEIRFSKGIARYTANFTPSTTAFTTDSYTTLLLHCDGSDESTTFTDDSYTGTPRHTITANGDVANSRAQKKVGDSSIYFDGSGDYLSLADSSDWDFASAGDFTMEAWIYPTSVTGTQEIFSQEDGVSNGWDFILNGQNIGIYVNSDFADFNCLSTNTPITINTWQHVAAVKDGDDYEVFVAGASVATVNSSQVDTFAAVLMIGNDVFDQEFTGYMDEIRISDSARYTGAFTPSTTAFTADANTMLLIHSNWDGGLGADSSGNYNTFTPTNLVATDQMIDTPTNSFATLNPLNKSSAITAKEGNLAYTQTSSWGGITGTFGMTSGKWYFELRRGAGGTSCLVGVAVLDYVVTLEPADNVPNAWRYRDDGTKRYNEVGGQSYGDTWTGTGDIIGVAVDMDNSAIYFSKNGTWQDSGDPTSGATATGAAYTSLTGTVVPVTGFYNGPANTGLNFGQDSSFAGTETAQGNQDSNNKGDFYYAPPTDFLALCTDNLPSPEIALPGENFNTLIYTGDGSTPRSITGLGFQPDTVLFKSRSNPGTDSSVMFNAVRGVEKAVYWHGADGERTKTTGLKSYDSDGWTMGNSNAVNKSAQPEVTWSWKGDGVAGGTTNTAGDIDTQVNVNTTAGFSIVTYTGDGVDGQTIGHGLSQKPDMIWIYDLTGPWPAAATAWMWNKGISSGAYDTYQPMGEDAFSTTPSEGYFTAMSSTLLTMTEGSSNIDNLNKSGDDYLMFCFHEIEGYSKFSSYEGNGNVDGPFIYTGFTPGMFFCKNIDEATSPAGDWPLKDNKRPAYNVEDLTIVIDRSGIAEYTDNEVDFVSNGIKIRNSDSQSNASSDTMVYAVFAENPFKTSNAR